MWRTILTYFDGEKETRHVVSSVDQRVISSAYQSLISEIDSLRKYDRGEKQIDAPDLRTAVRRLQRTI